MIHVALWNAWISGSWFAFLLLVCKEGVYDLMDTSIYDVWIVPGCMLVGYREEY